MVNELYPSKNVAVEDYYKDIIKQLVSAMSDWEGYAWKNGVYKDNIQHYFNEVIKAWVPPEINK